MGSQSQAHTRGRTGSPTKKALQTNTEMWIYLPTTEMERRAMTRTE